MDTRKLLYVDPQCPPGHVNFNGIWIRALTESGAFDVTLALPKEYESRLDYDRRKCRFVEIPSTWVPTPKSKTRGPLGRCLFRLRRIICLRKMLVALRPRDYDLVLFGSFDTPVAFFAPSQPHFVWVGHNLAEQLRGNGIARAMLRRIGAKSHLVGLGRYTAEKMKEAGIPHVVEIPHGFPAPFPEPCGSAAEMEREIFAPVKTHCDRKTLEALCAGSMSALLEEAGLRIVVRTGTRSRARIRLLEGRIPDGEYAARMASSRAILVFYEDGYERNSMILLEAMSAGRPVLMRRIPCFAHLEGTPGMYFFSTPEELESRIRELAVSPVRPDYGAVRRAENPRRIAETLAELAREGRLTEGRRGNMGETEEPTR